MKKEQRKYPRTKAKDMIEITKRLCSPRVQPAVLVGKRYIVKEVGNLNDGAPVLIVEHPDRKGVTMRINAHRFTWNVTSFEKMQKRQIALQYKLRDKCLNKMLEENMSSADAINVVYVPHVVEIFAVRTLLRCAEICKENMYSEYRATSRQVHVLEAENYREQIFEVKIEVYKFLQTACTSYENENKRIIKHLKENIFKELDKAYPKALPESRKKNPLRVCAIFGLILLRLLERCYLDHDNYLTAGIGERLYNENKRIADISRCLKVYAGDTTMFNFKAKSIVNAVDTMKKKLTMVQFKLEQHEKK